jgi:hypothetical protein
VGANKHKSSNEAALTKTQSSQELSAFEDTVLPQEAVEEIRDNRL